ncbi:MAG: hypothetical protein JWO86_5566 [Myxococcaceae bacterium]|nr:hypothetical protein [Myxococcaceae bacterium]
MKKLLGIVSLASFMACACAGAPSAKQPAEEGTFAFVDVNVVPMDSERIMIDQTVVVRAGTIVAMGTASTVHVPSGARVVNGHGKYLMPGLADMHAHLLREEDMLLYVARGVTTVRNMWGAPMHLDWRERIARHELVGPTIVTAGPIVDGDKPVHDGSLVVRTPEEAEQAVLLHRRAGYDFVKVYTGISPAAFERLATAANSAGLQVVGHVPRSVGLVPAIDAGQASIEHLSAFSEALQTNDSPVAGKFDGASRDRKLDFIDDAKLVPLVTRIHDRGAWVCPTRAVMNQNDGPEALERRLARPEMRYVGAFDLAIWRLSLGRSATDVAADARYNAFGDRLVTALHAGHVNLLAGTDTGNPFVVPGYSLHEELELLVRDGLTPYEALLASTRRAAEFLGKADFGSVTVGKRADLLLVDGNPLADVREADRITGVMHRGQWLDAAALAALLRRVEDGAAGHVSPFAKLPPLIAPGTTELSATFTVAWGDTPFGAERIVVARAAGGERVIHAQSFDPHDGQWMTLHVWSGDAGHGSRLLLDSDGAGGRGHVELVRDTKGAHIHGVVLPGIDAALDADLDATATLGVRKLLAGKLLLLPLLGKLVVGESSEVHDGELALGSKIDLAVRSWSVQRVADATVTRGGRSIATRNFTFTRGKDAPERLTLDEGGWPLRYEIPAFGSTIRFERVERVESETEAHRQPEP